MGSSKKKRSFSASSNHGFTSAGGRFGAKKQKLSSLSKSIRQSYTQIKSLQSAHSKKSNTLAQKKAKKREGKAKITYNRFQQILTIGEGNFSFTHALVAHFIAQHKSASAEGASSSSSSSSKYKKKEGVFDPSIHVPFLPPNTLFTNPTCLVVATCYDSWKELLFKYPVSRGEMATRKSECERYIE